MDSLPSSNSQSPRTRSKTKPDNARISIIKKSFKNSFGKVKNSSCNLMLKSSTTLEDENSSKQNEHTRKFEDFYEELDIVGEGAHAIVKKVFSKLDGNTNAVKIIRTKDPEVIIAVKNEYMNSICLHHPNIIKIHDLFIDEIKGKSYYVMEYLSLKSLDYYIKKQKRFAEPEISRILSQILKAIHYMHKKGICHRDLKPKNILIDPHQDFKIKIIDFGISKNFITYSFKNGQTSKNSSRMYTCTGTLAYCAPEIFNGEGYNHLVDIWATGVIAYQLFSGTLPFSSEYVSETIDQITKKPLDFPPNEWSHVSSLARDLVRRLLKKDYLHRISAEDALLHPFFAEKPQKLSFLKPNYSPEIGKKHQTQGYQIAKEFCSAHKMTLNSSGLNEKEFKILKLDTSLDYEEEKDQGKSNEDYDSFDQINGNRRDFVDNIERRKKIKKVCVVPFESKHLSKFSKQNKQISVSLIRPFDSMQNI